MMIVYRKTQISPQMIFKLTVSLVKILKYNNLHFEQTIRMPFVPRAIQFQLSSTATENESAILQRVFRAQR